MKVSLFDTVEALRLNEARKVFLLRCMEAFTVDEQFISALDAGCGLGLFSAALREHGLQVTAFDGRLENVTEARRRHPKLVFEVHDVEDSSLPELGQFDLVLCFGLLYHLENPFRAIRNLASMTGKILLMESVIAPGRVPAALLYEEEPGENQGLNYIAVIPTESSFVKALYLAGFPFVYRCATLPDHRDFRSSVMKRRRRTVLAGSRVRISSSLFRLAPAPRTEAYLWDSWWIRLIGSRRIRQLSNFVAGDGR